jgi:hypothetical protein
MSIVSSQEIGAFIKAAGDITISADQQALLDLATPLLQSKIEKAIGFALIQATYTEYYPDRQTNSVRDTLSSWDFRGGRMVAQERGGLYDKFLVLRRLPVRSITSIYDSPGAWDTAGGSFPASTLLPTNYYYLDISTSGLCETGRVIRNQGAWSKELRTIKITYVAGYSQDEINSDYGDLKLALLLAIQSFYLGTVLRSTAGGQGGGLITSTSITDFSVSFANPASLASFFGSDYTLPIESQRMLSRYVNLAAYF